MTHVICRGGAGRLFRLAGATLLVACAVFSSPASAAHFLAADTSPLQAAGLRCEYLTNPLGLDEVRPRLTWHLESPRRGEVQSAYRILAASSREALDDDRGDLWDSGRVESRETTHIEYGGSPLVSRQRVHWKVMAWDAEGVPGDWSAPATNATWEMGLLRAEDWSAAWIEAGAPSGAIEIVRATYYSVPRAPTPQSGGAVPEVVRRDVTERVRALLGESRRIVASNAALGGDPAVDVPKRLALEYRIDGLSFITDVAENATAAITDPRVPYLRRGFELDRPVESARLYVTALGLYEVWLNGRRVGDQHFAPGWTDYRKRVRYQVYDVTDQLLTGGNALGALVAPGWFSGRAGLFHARQFYGTSPALLAQLEVRHTDGSITRIVTDDSWRRHPSPIASADMMDGEIYDASSEIDGWSTPALDDSTWSKVETRAETRTLEATIDQPVRVLAELPAISVREPSPGRFVFDLGQNMVGVVRLRVDEPRGSTIVLRHAEMLNPDGTIYTANLRGAAAVDQYTCRGGGPEAWQPRFTFHGFRYVEVSGLSKPPSLDTVTGIVLGTDLPSAGSFACSDGRINQLQSNIRWGLRGNFVSVPTDCPQRDERMGWMADIQVFTPTAIFNADVAPFMTAWMRSVVDSQRSDGAHSDVAPVMEGLNYGTPAWADAGTIVPWAVYQRYGDRRILERNIDSMIRWVDWCRAHSTNLIRDRDRGNDYGDWLAIGANTPKDLIGTACFAQSTAILAQALRVLGRDDDAVRYETLFNEIKAAFIERYVSAEGRVAGDTQCGYALALRYNLLPDDLRANALERLIDDMRTKRWHLSTGFVGVANLLPVLRDAGRSDVAYRLLMKETFPSWLFSVAHGATTIWERWDGWTPERGVHPDASMNSFNHYALGSCGEWLYEGVAGIEPDPSHAGFSHFTLRPQIDGSLSWANATHRTIRGTIASSWRREGEVVAVNVTIPANTTATLHLPAQAGSEIRESGRLLGGPGAEGVDGVRSLTRDQGTAVIALGSGRYEFTSTRPFARGSNPVFPGRYADPEVAFFEGRYWIYPTTSAPYDEQLSFDAFSSPDLVHWTRHPNVLNAADVSWARRAMWAPSVIEKDGRYYFFFGANDIQKDGEVGGIGVAVADSPAGPFKDLLGKPLIDRFHNGAQPIDQFVFRNRDGAHFLIYGGWKHCNIARLRDDFQAIEATVHKDHPVPFLEITPQGYVEGPVMFERGGRYYFMWSEGGWTGPDYSVAWAVADSPFGPFVRAGTVLSQNPDIATGAGHHSVIRIPGTAGAEEWRIVYHRRPLGRTDRNDREVCVDRLQFDAEGRILPVTITFEGAEAAPGK